MTTDRLAASPSKDRANAWAYAWWFLVGALIGLGIAALLTIGVLFILAGAGLGVIGALTPALRNGLSAGLAGMAAPAMYLAWLNRGGPGEVCTVSGTSTTCVDAYSPWPFVVVAVLLVGASIFLARRLAH